MGESRFIKIASAKSTVEAEQMIQFLRDNGISAYRQSDITDLYFGNSTVGEDVMVPEKKIDSARSIIKNYNPIKTNTTAYHRQFSKVQMILFSIMLAIIVMFIVVPLFFL